MAATKPIHLSKSVVVRAYRLVKSNAGGAGVEQQTLDDFDQDLQKNLYKIWYRMSSGSYFPPAVKQVGVPKKSGGLRYLGIPTVSDRIAQMVIKLLVEPLWEPLFHPDSYGYRPDKSALQAIEVTRRRCWRYDWLVEFDIKGAFDNIDHELLLKAVRKHTPERWQVMYIERWLTAPTETSECVTVRRRGTPSSEIPAFSHLSIMRLTMPSLIRRSRNDRRWACVMLSKYFEMSASITHRWPCSMIPVRNAFRASWADRPGRKPYEHGRKSASYIGSRSIRIARCATLSSNVGMPKGRFVPSAFGM